MIPITPIQRKLLQHLVKNGGKAGWTELTRTECSSGTRLMKRGLAKWVITGTRASGKVLHITDAGRKALEESGS